MLMGGIGPYWIRPHIADLRVRFGAGDGGGDGRNQLTRCAS